MNKTAKQRLSQTEIDGLVQQAASKKPLSAGSGQPVPRPQRQEPKPTVDSKRRSETAAPSSSGAPSTSGQEDNRNQTSGRTEERLPTQQTQSAPEPTKEEPQPARKSSEAPVKSDNGPSKVQKQVSIPPLSSSSRGPLQLEQSFQLLGEGASDSHQDMVMAVLNKKLSRLR
jgi:hypothetical protein